MAREQLQLTTEVGVGRKRLDRVFAHVLHRIPADEHDRLVEIAGHVELVTGDDLRVQQSYGGFRADVRLVAGGGRVVEAQDQVVGVDVRAEV